MGHVPTLDAATLTPDQVSQSRYVLWAEEKLLRLLVGFIAELVLIAQMLFSFVFHVRLQIWGLSENRWLQNLINPYCHKTSKQTTRTFASAPWWPKPPGLGTNQRPMCFTSSQLLLLLEKGRRLLNFTNASYRSFG